MKKLQKRLASYFQPERQRTLTKQRRAREKTSALAKTLHVELEKLEGSGVNVWPLRNLAEDPFEGDHYASDWDDALAMVHRYAACPELMKPRECCASMGTPHSCRAPTPLPMHALGSEQT